MRLHFFFHSVLCCDIFHKHFLLVCYTYTKHTTCSLWHRKLCRNKILHHSYHCIILRTRFSCQHDQMKIQKLKSFMCIYSQLERLVVVESFATNYTLCSTQFVFEWPHLISQAKASPNQAKHALVGCNIYIDFRTTQFTQPSNTNPNPH